MMLRKDWRDLGSLLGLLGAAFGISLAIALPLTYLILRLVK